MTRVRLHADARAFLVRAKTWLEAAPMEHAMALQSAHVARNAAPGLRESQYWATLEAAGEIVGCAFCTPPYRLGITALPPTAVPPLLDSVGTLYRTLSGVAGPEPAASTFAAAWTDLRGGSWYVQARQRLLVHRAIVPAAEPPGSLRLATPSDGALAHQWGDEFARESGLAGLDGAVCALLIRDRRLYFWDDGAPRCMVGVLRETRDAAAIGILFTPPALRDRGYATAAVFAFNRYLLDRGLAHSYFFLDPSNPAADSICWRLGYGVVQETADIDFAPA